LIIFSALGTLRTSAILQLSGYADNWSVVMRTTEGANYRNHYRDSELTKRADAIEWLKRHGSGFRGSKKREEKRWQNTKP
jgi:hypothetical protein